MENKNPCQPTLGAEGVCKQFLGEKANGSNLAGGVSQKEWISSVLAGEFNLKEIGIRGIDSLFQRVCLKKTR